jgi:5-methylthioadenosine/S-adenosylhomocysteine deaminase
MQKIEGFIFNPQGCDYGVVTIKNDRIHSISSRRAPKKIERLILPGFISTNIHTVQTHARNLAENIELLDWLERVIFPFEAALTPKTAYASAYSGMNECLRFGITTILDMATTRHTHKIFEAARDSGIRAFIGKALMDQGPKNLIDQNPLDELEDLIHTWHLSENKRLETTLCPRFVLSCSEELLRTVGSLSEKFQLLHHTHASENKKECDWISKKYKKSNIELLESLGCLNPLSIIAHCVHISKRDLTILRKRKCRISHCPTSNLKLASGYADIKTFDGIPLSLGVDGAACNNLLDPFFEMRIAHLLSRLHHGLSGLSAQKIFEIATLGGAEALHKTSQIGSLVEEKKADIIAVNIPETVSFNSQFPYESLLHSLSARDIAHVWVDGRKIF